MINLPLLEGWLEHAVAFANLPEPVGVRAALHALRGPQRVAFRSDARKVKVRIGAGLGDLEPKRWPLPERGYPALHSAWRAWCEDFVVGDAVERLRDQCIDWSMSAEGRELITFQSVHTSPFGFDQQGTPQLGHVEATSPEGMLALVGAELLAPGARLTLWRCTVCGKYHARALDRRRPGGPRKTCENCKPKSTPRVHKFRNKLKSKKRNRHA